MIDRPIFHAHITVRILDADRMLLLLEGEGEQRLITAVSCGRIAQLIDGNHTIDELVGALRGQVAPEQIYYVIEMLKSGGYLTPADSEVPRGVSSFWRMLGVEPEGAIQILRNSAVSLTALGGTDSGELQEALSRIGIGISPNASFGVVLTDDYLDENLHALNAQALSAGTVWMIGKPVGHTQWLGPIFRPGATGCWCCLAHRLRDNRNMAAAGDMNAGIVDLRKSCAALPSSVSAVTNLMATEIAKWLLLGKSEALEGLIWTLDSKLVATTHRLTRRPQCACCGNPAGSGTSNQDFELMNTLKNIRVEGSHRTAMAEETVRKLEPHVSPITGIISIIHRADLSTNSEAHIYIALQNKATSMHGPTGVIGKGSSASEALASCLGEAVERYSCWFHGDVQRIRASYADLAPNAICATELLNFSDRQYNQRQVWNAGHGRFHWVPERLEEAREIDWTPVRSLTRKLERYVPAAYCYFQYPGEDSRFFSSDSNGCASGNTLEEALLHGLLELVERDAVALWWYNRTKHAGVNLESFHDRFISATLDNLRQSGREIHVLDLTSDLGVPCFAAVSWNSEGTRIALGSAADLDPRIGAIRAVCELNQLLEYSAREEADQCERRAEGRDISHWLRTARIEEHSYLMPSDEVHACDFQNLSGRGILEDVNTCKNILERHDLDALALNMTQPDIGFPTVRVIVPGLRHFWARFGPGRLYDIPVQLGRMSHPLAEAELNPVPYML